jgi:GT2 family glycosyltransferase
MRTERLCYAAAINQAASIAQAKDWYIILSNDVLCTGPFMDTLAAMDKRFVVGPQIFRLARHERYPFVMGWCVCTAVSIFEELGGWDENYVVSSWEDVDYSTMVRESGYHLSQVELPFVHLDQRQRFNLPEFVGTHERNMHYFHHKHGVKQ